MVLGEGFEGFGHSELFEGTDAAGVDDAEDEVEAEALADDGGAEPAEVGLVGEVDIAAVAERFDLFGVEERADERFGVGGGEGFRVGEHWLDVAEAAPGWRGSGAEVDVGGLGDLSVVKEMVDVGEAGVGGRGRFGTGLHGGVADGSGVGLVEEGDVATGEGGLGFLCGFNGAALDFLGAWQGSENFWGDVLRESGEFCEAFLALGEGFIGVAFFGEAGSGAFASIAEERVDIATEEGGDVDFHFFALEVGVVDDFAIDGARLIFREHDGGFGADAGAGGAVGFAVVLILDLQFFVLIDAVDAEEAEGEALHAVGAAVVIDDGEPGFPVTCVGGAGLFTEFVQGLCGGCACGEVERRGGRGGGEVADFGKVGRVCGGADDGASVFEEGPDGIEAALRGERGGVTGLGEVESEDGLVESHGVSKVRGWGVRRRRANLLGMGGWVGAGR